NRRWLTPVISEICFNENGPPMRRRASGTSTSSLSLRSIAISMYSRTLVILAPPHHEVGSRVDQHSGLDRGVQPQLYDVDPPRSELPVDGCLGPLAVAGGRHVVDEVVHLSLVLRGGDGPGHQGHVLVPQLRLCEYVRRCRISMRGDPSWIARRAAAFHTEYRRRSVDGFTVSETLRNDGSVTPEIWSTHSL